MVHRMPQATLLSAVKREQKKLQQSGFILHNDGAKARLSRVSLGVDKLSCCLRRWAGASVGEKTGEEMEGRR